VHAFVNELERSAGTYLYGRRMYETMVFWQTVYTIADQPSVVQEVARLWQAAHKIVYSTTLPTVQSARTQLERTFDPDAVRRLKAAADRDLSVGGPDLAAQAITAGLVDEYHLIVVPVSVGGGKPALPRHVRLALDLVAERRFASGVIYLHYRAAWKPRS
jgi:dihydrofolate reductase